MKMRVVGILMLCAAVFGIGCTSKVGLIALDTRPQGAAIYLDEINLGETPVQFEFDLEKPATLKIEKEGYYPQTESLNVGWVKSEYHRGNLIKGYHTSQETTRKTWEVHTTRDLIRIE